MSWRGRKRKAGRRERNGRIKRPSTVARNVMGVVLAQPHRRGSRDPLCESPLGRFVLRCGLDPVCYDAALDYARLVRRVFAVKGVPQPCGHGHHANAERELDTDSARRLQHELDETEQRLRSVSRVGADALRTLAVYEREVSLEQTDEAALVLSELGAS